MSGPVGEWLVEVGMLEVEGNDVRLAVVDERHFRTKREAEAFAARWQRNRPDRSARVTPC